MRFFSRAGALVIGAAVLTGAALADEGISIKVTNDSTVDVYITVTDANSHAPIIEHQRLNGFATLPITATADDTGHANITWTAISVDTNDKHCGRGTRSKLESDAVVNVHADSSCSS